MKILCVSDQIDSLVYSTTVKERYADIDAVFCAGDLPMDYVEFIVTSLSKPTFFVFGNHNLKEYKYYAHKDGIHPALSNVYITMDDYKGRGADYVSNTVMRLDRLGFALPNGKTTPLLVCGVSGSLKYNNGQAQFSEREMRGQLRRMLPALIWNKIRYGRYCDIFLTHASPRHIHDKEDPCHKGFECFNWFIKKIRPAMLIHGHIHLYDYQDIRVTESEDTTVINAYSHIVLDFNPDFDEKGALIGKNLSILSDR